MANKENSELSNIPLSSDSEHEHGKLVFVKSESTNNGRHYSFNGNNQLGQKNVRLLRYLALPHHRNNKRHVF